VEETTLTSESVRNGRDAMEALRQKHGWPKPPPEDILSPEERVDAFVWEIKQAQKGLRKARHYAASLRGVWDDPLRFMPEEAMDRYYDACVTLVPALLTLIAQILKARRDSGPGATP
jgi:hypothetical protein